MLLRATFRNILSFLDEVQVSFIAGKGSVLPEHVYRAEKRDDISVLKVGIIYGANASGKSNIIHCINTLKLFAMKGLPKNHITPFKLGGTKGLPSKIEVEFKQNGSYYAYGIEFDVHGLREEWLFEIGSRKENLIFARTVLANGSDFKFGNINGTSETVQLLNFIAHGTPANNSFLSEYVMRNGVGLDSVKDARLWFKDKLHVVFPATKYMASAYSAEKNDTYKIATQQLLKFFNTGIVDVRKIPIPREETGVPSGVIDDIIADSQPGTTCLLRDMASNSLIYIDFKEDGTIVFYKQITIHKGIDGNEVAFELNEESDGSIRLLDFIPMLIDLRINDAVYLIDEIDRSMHPMLSQKFLEFYGTHVLKDDKDVTFVPHDTQIIFTTHESNLLDLKQVRADEIWFVEKDETGMSHLTSLAEYKPREDVRKGYLLGRYGAIPFFAPIKKLNW